MPCILPIKNPVGKTESMTYILSLKTPVGKTESMTYDVLKLIIYPPKTLWENVKRTVFDMLLKLLKNPVGKIRRK